MSETNRAEEQAKAQLESIVEMVAALRKANEEGDQDAEEEATLRIQEDALSCEVRSGWTMLGEELKAEEFCILLCTGGPACRIVGDLDSGEPSRPRLQYQDWGTPWTELVLDSAGYEALLTYCQQFYFGE